MPPLSPPGRLDDLAQRLHRRADRLDDVLVRLSRDLEERPANWEGRLAEEFTAHAENRRRQLRQAAGELRGAAMVATNVADALRTERAELRALEDRVRAALRDNEARLPYPAPDTYDPRWRQAARDLGVI
jgi:uncharacterized protein YukE